MEKKNEKEMKKAKETKKKLSGRKEEKASRIDNRDKSEMALVREAYRVKMSEINSLSNHERKQLEKRTDKRYAIMLKRMKTLFPIMLLIYGIVAILLFTYYKHEGLFLVMMPLLIICSYSIAYRKGLKISVIFGPIVYTAELVVITILAYVYKYSFVVGLSGAISAIPDIISEISVDDSATFISHTFVWVIISTVGGLLFRLINHPRKYLLKHEYVKMKNGD